MIHGYVSTVGFMCTQFQPANSHPRKEYPMFTAFQNLKISIFAAASVYRDSVAVNCQDLWATKT
jgi:hypothetical protein